MSNDHLLPINASPAEKAQALAVARISAVPVVVDTLWNPSTCPAALLPWLAWALSVDVWDATWSEQVKRDVITESMAIHRKKGTPWAVEQAMHVSGAPDLQLQEWFEYGGAPYTFRATITTITVPLSPALANRLMADVAKFKNARSWGSLRIAQQGDLRLYCHMLAIHRPRVTVMPY
ncbi:MAG: phage tail protein I [Proteobacteria bacterium]|nr:phage tail protein I [Pseudomonadota bacterium]MBU1640065.1 phage tail protein I [Pseudomonadota bacterium]